MSIGHTRTSAWLLERLAQGELGPERRARIRDRLAGEGRSLDDELAAIALSDREILSILPARVAAAAIRQRAGRAAAPAAPPRRWMALGAGSAFAAAALALFLLRPIGSLPFPGAAAVEPDSSAATDLEPTTDKGTVWRGPRLLVYRQRASATPRASGERLPDGARAARGDVVQLAYVVASPASRQEVFGVLLSIDGAGRVTRHLPEDAASAASRLRAGREISLPFAYQLDDAPGFERFVLVTAPAAFDVGPIVEAARALAARGNTEARSLPLVLGPSFQQASLVLRKTAKGAP